MLPRTFVRMDTDDAYVPRRLTQSSNGDLWCSCVYTCDQFMTYPVDVHGRRIIPLNATCPNLAKMYWRIYLVQWCGQTTNAASRYIADMAKLQ